MNCNFVEIQTVLSISNYIFNNIGVWNVLKGVSIIWSIIWWFTLSTYTPLIGDYNIFILLLNRISEFVIKQNVGVCYLQRGIKAKELIQRDDTKSVKSAGSCSTNNPNMNYHLQTSSRNIPTYLYILVIRWTGKYKINSDRYLEI